MDVQVDGKTLHVLLSEEAIRERVAALGAAITDAYRGRDLVLVIVLKGSILFAADLCREVKLPMDLEFIGLSSYGSSTKSSGVVRLTLDVSAPIAGKDVLVVEDIVDTGLTMQYLLENLNTRHPASLKVCTLLHKPARTQLEVPLEYVGFVIDDHFVVGYGLDIDQKYRNLPYIGYMVDDEVT